MVLLDEKWRFAPAARLGEDAISYALCSRRRCMPLDGRLEAVGDHRTYAIRSHALRVLHRCSEGSLGAELISRRCLRLFHCPHGRGGSTFQNSGDTASAGTEASIIGPSLTSSGVGVSLSDDRRPLALPLPCTTRIRSWASIILLVTWLRPRVMELEGHKIYMAVHGVLADSLVTVVSVGWFGDTAV